MKQRLLQLNLFLSEWKGRVPFTFYVCLSLLGGLTMPEWKGRVPLTRSHCERITYVPLVPTAPPTMTVTGERRAQRWGQPRRVVLSRHPGTALGVSIVGGKVDIISNLSEDGEEKAIFGIFIKNVVPDSPAGKSGELHTGDRILEVDGVCVRSAPHERAVALIKAAGDQVALTVQSLLAWNTDSSDVDASTPPTSPTPSVKSKGPAPAPPIIITQKSPQHEIKITVTADSEVEKENTEKESSEKESISEPETPQGKPVYSDSDSSDEEEDGRELGGRTYTDKGVEVGIGTERAQVVGYSSIYHIDRASAGAIKRSKEEKQADPEEEDEFGYTS
ncbi:InaD-like protein, partial [Eumeta japonica]